MATVSTQYIKDVLNTLPIGYYLGSRAEVEFSETAYTSMCNPITGKIIVSANNVRECLKNLPDDSDTEEFTRDALYHEVSHLILTPKCLSPTKALNIMEDERIESILSKYYQKVNFKRFVFEMNHWTPDAEIENDIQFFFNIVRFRNGPKQFVDRVPKIIQNYSKLNCLSSWLEGVSDYMFEVEAFFKECSDYFFSQKHEEMKNNQNQKSLSDNQQQMPGQSEEKTQNNDENQDSNVPGSSNGNDSEKNLTGDDDEDNLSEEESEVVDEDNSQKMNGEGNVSGDQTMESPLDEEYCSDDDAQSGDDQTEPVDDDSEEDEVIRQARKESEKNAMDSDRIAELFKDVTSQIFNKYVDPMICSNIRRIITRACKKRSNRTGVINGHAGKIDPRSVGIRRDYRWFQKKGDNGSNKFDKIHLILWVDKSGSFHYSMPKVNSMIMSLQQVMKVMPNDFSFDVVVMDSKNEIYDNTMPIHASGGNFFGPNVENISKKLTKTGWSNYNVVVWDGDLRSDWREGGYDYTTRSYPCKSVSTYLKLYRRAFNIFNNSHSIIVSDTSNEKYLKHLKNARMKLIQNNYVNEFIKVVIELLDHML